MTSFGIATRTSSPSECIVLHNEVFVKVFLNSIYISEDRIIDANIEYQISALAYEQKMYELIDSLNCPFFVKFIKNEYDILFSEYENNILKHINTSNIQLCVKRSLVKMMLNPIDKYKFSVDDTKNLNKNSVINGLLYNDRLFLRQKIRYKYQEILDNYNKSTVNIIYTHYNPHAIYLYYANNFYNDILSKKETITKLDFYKNILLQVSIAIYYMEKSEINHNDLHTKNILIFETKQKDIKVEVENNIFSFCTFGFCIQIFDYDRAYCSKLGDNKILDSKDFESTVQYENKFVKNKDMEHFLVHFLDIIHEYELGEIQKIVYDKDDFITALEYIKKLKKLI